MYEVQTLVRGLVNWLWWCTRKLASFGLYRGRCDTGSKHVSQQRFDVQSSNLVCGLGTWLWGRARKLELFGIHRAGCDTGSELISQQHFDIRRPNLAQEHGIWLWGRTMYLCNVLLYEGQTWHGTWGASHLVFYTASLPSLILVLTDLDKEWWGGNNGIVYPVLVIDQWERAWRTEERVWEPPMVSV